MKRKLPPSQEEHLDRFDADLQRIESYSPSKLFRLQQRLPEMLLNSYKRTDFSLPDDIWLLIIEEVVYLLWITRAAKQVLSFALVSKKWQSFSFQIFQKCFVEFKAYNNFFLSKFLNTQDLHITKHVDVSTETLKLCTNLTSLDTSLAIEQETSRSLTNLTSLTLGWNLAYKDTFSFFGRLTSLSLFNLPVTATQLKNLNFLSFSKTPMTNQQFLSFKNVTTLKILNSDESVKYKLTDTSLKQFTKLKILEIKTKIDWSDKSLSLLTNLESLTIDYNDLITSSSIRLLTKLEELHLKPSPYVYDDCLEKLSKLKRVTLGENMTGNGLQFLKSLEFLNVYYSDVFEEKFIENSINLKILEVGETMEGYSLQFLTNLEGLVIRDGEKFNSTYLENLPNLVSLKDQSNTVTNKTLKKLTNLEKLELNDRNEGQEKVKETGLGRLTKLKELILIGTYRIHSLPRFLYNLKELTLFRTDLPLGQEVIESIHTQNPWIRKVEKVESSGTIYFTFLDSTFLRRKQENKGSEKS